MEAVLLSVVPTMINRDRLGNAALRICMRDLTGVVRCLAESKIGTFSDALMAEAKKNNWIVISMKNDWKTIFPPARQ